MKPEKEVPRIYVICDIYIHTYNIQTPPRKKKAK